MSIHVRTGWQLGFVCVNPHMHCYQCYHHRRLFVQAVRVARWIGRKVHVLVTLPDNENSQIELYVISLA
jgi:hypothetical protein